VTRTIVCSTYAAPFQMAAEATLGEFVVAWGNAYVVNQSARIEPGWPFRLVEDERARIEAELNLDLERAGRPERVDLLAEMGEAAGDLRLQWRQR